MVGLAAVLFNVAFFAFVAPAIKSARLDRTARAFLAGSGIDAGGLARLTGSGRRLFGGDAGLWAVPFTDLADPTFPSPLLRPMSGPVRAEALEALRLRLPPPIDPAFVNAPVWRGYGRLGRGTFCAARSCVITAIRVGPRLYLEIAAR